MQQELVVQVAEQCQWRGEGTTIARPAIDGGCLQNRVSNRAVNTYTHTHIHIFAWQQAKHPKIVVIAYVVSYGLLHFTHTRTHTDTELNPTMRCLEKRTAQPAGEVVGRGRAGQIKKCVSNFLAAITFH